MELRQLEYFVAVAEEASFTRAARRVRISQSGVSAQVRRLERELGVELFDRSTRATRLTAAGRAVLQHARATLSCAGAVQHVADELVDLVRGQMRLGMVIGCTVTPLFSALAEFHAAYPGVEVSMSEGNSDALIDAVRRAAIDIALVGVAGAPPDDLGSLTVVSEGLSALVAPGHPLAEAGRLSLAELALQRLVCMPIGTGVRSVLERGCAAAGLRPTVAIAASAAGAIADLAARGVGVGVLSASMAHEHRDRARVLAVEGIATPAVLGLVWRRDPSRAVTTFLEYARRGFGGTPGSYPAG